MGWGGPLLCRNSCAIPRGEAKHRKHSALNWEALWKGAGGATAIMPTRLGKVAEFSEQANAPQAAGASNRTGREQQPSVICKGWEGVSSEGIPSGINWGGSGSVSFSLLSTESGGPGFWADGPRKEAEPLCIIFQKTVKASEWMARLG